MQLVFIVLNQNWIVFTCVLHTCLLLISFSLLCSGVVFICPFILITSPHCLAFIHGTFDIDLPPSFERLSDLSISFLVLLLFFLDIVSFPCEK